MNISERIAQAVTAATEKALARLAEAEQAVDAAIEQALAAAEERIARAVEGFQARMTHKLDQLAARIEEVATQAVERAVAAVTGEQALPAATDQAEESPTGEPRADLPERELAGVGAGAEPSANGQHSDESTSARRGRRRNS